MQNVIYALRTLDFMIRLSLCQKHVPFSVKNECKLKKKYTVEILLLKAYTIRSNIFGAPIPTLALRFLAFPTQHRNPIILKIWFRFSIYLKNQITVKYMMEPHRMNSN